ncbi:MAG: hypothetical protein VB980_03705 [Opitutales bacterium]|jgi:hypothetical protein
MMKSIDLKSLLIGALPASTIFLGMTATDVKDKWDARQKWETNTFIGKKISQGW